MTIALTGATGFVGRQILRALINRGCAVRVLVRDPKRLIDEAKTGQVDIAQTEDLFSEPPERLKHLLSGTDTLLHAAWYAEPGKYMNSPLNFNCVAGSLNLSLAFAAAGGRRIVGIGTCAEYDLTAGLITTETPLAPKSLYAACKASTFQMLKQFSEDCGLSYAWCRLFYLYGEGEDPRRLVPYVRQQLHSGQEVLLTLGDQVRDFLDVAEAGRLIADVALSDHNNAANICSGYGITVRQLVESIADEYGRRDLLHFGARTANLFDPPSVVGIPTILE